MHRFNWLLRESDEEGTLGECRTRRVAAARLSLYLHAGVKKMLYIPPIESCTKMFGICAIQFRVWPFQRAEGMVLQKRNVFSAHFIGAVQGVASEWCRRKE